MKTLLKCILFAMLATTITTCATVDCSKFADTNPKRCKCIRDNGDHKRAKECSDIANEAFREKAKKDCMRKCYDMIDCERCLGI